MEEEKNQEGALRNAIEVVYDDSKHDHAMVSFNAFYHCASTAWQTTIKKKKKEGA